MTKLANAVETMEVVFPEHANHYGTLFGGQALLMMSKVAFLAARQLAQADVVMASCSNAQFLMPVPQGSALMLRALVSRVGRSSMTVCVTGLVPQVQGDAEAALQSLFEFVAVDGQGRPMSIPNTAATYLPKEPA